MKRIGFCLLVLLLQRSIAYAQGDLLAYEGFDYPEDVQLLEGCEGGFGFQGPWQKGGFNAIQSKHVSLTDGTRINRGVITNGRAAVAKSVNSIGGLLRNFSHPIGQPDSRVYVSFLVEPGPNLGSGAFGGFYGLTLSSKSADQLHIGGGAKGIGMGNRGGTKTIRTKTVPKSGETLLVVLRAEFKQGNDTFSLFINPSPGAAEPPSEFVKSDLDTGEVNGLVIYSTGSVIIDEIRVGKTFESVTPVSDKPTLDIPSEATPSGDKAASMSQGESKPRSKAAASTNSGPRRQSLDAAELDLHGTKVIIPFNSKQYLRMSNAQPKVFQTMVVEPIKPSEVVEAFYPIDLTRARSSEWVLIVN